MKMKKAMGIDSIPTKAWKYAGERLWNRLMELLNMIWHNGTIPKDWRKNIIVPLYKRGDKEKTGNYRGISLLCIAYKIYAEMIRDRIENEVKEKGMVSESQASFRRGRATIDNIIVLNHLMQREKRQGGKDGKVYMLFADIKAAFDNVERSTLWRELRRKVIKDLIRRMEKMYERTKTVIRTNQGYMDSFRTTKEGRVVC